MDGRRQALRAAARRTGFPVFGSVNAYRKQWTRTSGYFQTRGMPLHAQAIIEDVQPYHRRNAYQGHPLWVLRGLSNADKHEALHIVGSSAGQGRSSVAKMEGGVVPVKPVKFFNGPFEDGAVVARWPHPTSGTEGMEISLHVHFAFHVAFSKAGPGRGREVIQTLTDLRNEVDAILNRLAPFG